jgi:hypothetical protein
MRSIANRLGRIEERLVATETATAPRDVMSPLEHREMIRQALEHYDRCGSWPSTIEPEHHEHLTKMVRLYDKMAAEGQLP